MQFANSLTAVHKTLQVKCYQFVITVYADKSFDFVIKQPPVAVQLIEAAK